MHFTKVLQALRLRRTPRSVRVMAEPSDSKPLPHRATEIQILPRSATNINLIGGDAYARAHRRVLEICEDVFDALTDPYAPPPRNRLHGWVRDFDEIRVKRRVPGSDQHRVAAHLALVRLLLLGVKQGPKAGTVAPIDEAEGVAQVAQAVSHVEADQSLHAVALAVLWSAHRLQLPLPPKLSERAERLLPPLDRIGSNDESASAIFMRGALEVDHAWTTYYAGCDVAADVAARLWRLLHETRGAGGYFAHRYSYLYAQAYALDDLANGKPPDDSVRVFCDALRDRLGHRDDLAIEIQIFCGFLDHVWPHTWRPAPAWVTTFPTINFKQFVATTDSAAALRYLLVQAEGSMHRPGRYRAPEFDKLVHYLKADPSVYRFNERDRHLLLWGLAKVCQADQLTRYNKLVQENGEGKFYLQLYDFVGACLNSRPETRITRSFTYTGYSNDSVEISLLHPRFKLRDSTPIQGFTPAMAVTLGRQERELLTFLVSHMGYELSGDYVEQRVMLSLACLEYAVEQLRPDGIGPIVLCALDELIETISVARQYAMPIDTDGYLTLMEAALPWREPGGAHYALQFGHLASGDTRFIENQSGRVSDYWEAGLSDLRQCDAHVEVESMISALVNTAVSTNLHARYGAMSKKSAGELTDRGLELLREAIGRHDSSHTPVDPYLVARMYACTAWLLYVRSRLDHPENEDSEVGWVPGAVTSELIEYQRLAYETLPSDPEARQYVLNGIIDLTVWVDPDDWPEAAARYEDVLLSVVASPRADIGRVVESVTLLTHHYRSAGRAEDLAKPVLSLLPRIDELARLPLPHSALRELQGLISDAAVAECAAGRPQSAAHIAETGTGRILGNLSPSGSHPEQASDSPDLVAAATGRPLVYLLAGSEGGAAIAFLPDRPVRHVMVPKLTDAWRQFFKDETSDEADKSDQPFLGTSTPAQAPPWAAAPAPAELDRGVLRAEPGSTTPGPEHLYQVLDQMGDMLTDALDRLGIDPDADIDLVPVGGLSRLPWQAVFLESGLGHCATQTSAASLNRAARTPRVKGVPRGLAVTSPDPSILWNRVLPSLDAAAQEGTALAKQFGAEHLTGPAATLTNVKCGLGEARRFVHFAVHGHVAPHSWDASYLVFAPENPCGDNNSTEHELGEDETNQFEPLAVIHEESRALLSLSDLITLGMRAELAFLAACWSAAPNQSLPEESISFPSATLRAGARCVIAPLWPVEDVVTKDFVLMFYRHWLQQGATVAGAFRAAVEDSRDRHPASTTWAAFTLHGAGFGEV